MHIQITLDFYPQDFNPLLPSNWSSSPKTSNPTWPNDKNPWVYIKPTPLTPQPKLLFQLTCLHVERTLANQLVETNECDSPENNFNVHVHDLSDKLNYCPSSSSILGLSSITIHNMWWLLMIPSIFSFTFHCMLHRFAIHIIAWTLCDRVRKRYSKLMNLSKNA